MLQGNLDRSVNITWHFVLFSCILSQFCWIVFNYECRETGNIEYTRQRQTQLKKPQRVGYHYTQTNINYVKQVEVKSSIVK
jgi:hypothetical protein